MKKYLVLILLAMLQGCAQSSGGAHTSENELYQPTNTTDAQQKYMQQQRAIHPF